jgi:hypothetical protein
MFAEYVFWGVRESMEGLRMKRKESLIATAGH